MSEKLSLNLGEDRKLAYTTPEEVEFAMKMGQITSQEAYGMLQAFRLKSAEKSEIDKFDIPDDVLKKAEEIKLLSDSYAKAPLEYKKNLYDNLMASKQSLKKLCESAGLNEEQIAEVFAIINISTEAPAQAKMNADNHLDDENIENKISDEEKDADVESLHKLIRDIKSRLSQPVSKLESKLHLYNGALFKKDNGRGNEFYLSEDKDFARLFNFIISKRADFERKLLDFQNKYNISNKEIETILENTGYSKMDERIDKIESFIPKAKEVSSEELEELAEHDLVNSEAEKKSIYDQYSDRIYYEIVFSSDDQALIRAHQKILNDLDNDKSLMDKETFEKIREEATSRLLYISYHMHNSEASKDLLIKSRRLTLKEHFGGYFDSLKSELKSMVKNYASLIAAVLVTSSGFGLANLFNKDSQDSQFVDGSRNAIVRDVSDQSGAERMHNEDRGDDAYESKNENSAETVEKTEEAMIADFLSSQEYKYFKDGDKINFSSEMEKALNNRRLTKYDIMPGHLNKGETVAESHEAIKKNAFYSPELIGSLALDGKVDGFDLKYIDNSGNFAYAYSTDQINTAIAQMKTNPQLFGDNYSQFTKALDEAEKEKITVEKGTFNMYKYFNRESGRWELAYGQGDGGSAILYTLENGTKVVYVESCNNYYIMKKIDAPLIPGGGGEEGDIPNDGGGGGDDDGDIPGGGGNEEIAPTPPVPPETPPETPPVTPPPPSSPNTPPPINKSKDPSRGISNNSKLTKRDSVGDQLVDSGGVRSSEDVTGGTYEALVAPKNLVGEQKIGEAKRSLEREVKKVDESYKNLSEEELSTIIANSSDGVYDVYQDYDEVAPGARPIETSPQSGNQLPAQPGPVEGEVGEFQNNDKKG